MNYVQQYINKIRSGEINVGIKVRQLYFGIIEPIIKDEHPLYYFDEAKGGKFIEFAERFCKQSKGEWREATKTLAFSKGEISMYLWNTKERQWSKAFQRNIRC